MPIVIILYKFLSRIIKFVKIFYLKLLKIDMNIFLKLYFFGICSFILIKLIYDILIEKVIVSCLNIYIVNKEIF